MCNCRVVDVLRNNWCASQFAWDLSVLSFLREGFLNQMRDIGNWNTFMRARKWNIIFIIDDWLVLRMEFLLNLRLIVINNDGSRNFKIGDVVQRILRFLILAEERIRL
jgi:hypothetical protein